MYGTIKPINEKDRLYQSTAKPLCKSLKQRSWWKFCRKINYQALGVPTTQKFQNFNTAFMAYKREITRHVAFLYHH